MNVGDYTLEDTVTIPFTTRAFSTGIPTALVSGEVQVYEDTSVTQITAAETTTVSLDTVAGFNITSIAATAANGFEAGKSYTAMLSAGTVDSVSAIGEVVGHFTLARSAAAGDLANGTDGLGAIKAVVDAIPTTAMRGTDNAALASVATEARLAELDAGNLPTDIAAIPTTMVGTDNAALASVCTEARLAELDAGNLPTDIAAIPTTAMRGTDNAALASVATEARLAELDAANLPTDIAAIPTTAMRGTDNAALASVATEARLAELDAANLPTDIAAIPTTAMRGTDSAATEAKQDIIDANVDLVLADTGTDGVKLNATQPTGWAANLAASAGQIVIGAADAGTLSTTQMTSNLTEATDDHYNGRVIIWTSGVLAGQATDITDYSGATGLLTYTAVTEAPSASDTFVIV